MRVKWLEKIGENCETRLSRDLILSLFLFIFLQFSHVFSEFPTFGRRFKMSQRVTLTVASCIVENVAGRYGLRCHHVTGL